jgi:CPA2 family monovalent cation:H+ antiporter-2
MDETVLLVSLALFLLLAAVCSIVFNKIRLPPLIGYLMAGIIVANFVSISEEQMDVVDILSDMGLTMLMFCIGLEINLKKLRKQGVFAMKVAMVEIPFMVLAGTIFGGLFGLDSFQSLCLGAVMAGSSTAVVLGVLKIQNRLEKDRIDTLILVIIMEDIAQVIVLSMITPLMAGSALDAGGLAAMVVSIIAFMAASIIFGVRLMPRVINWVSDNVSSEVLVLFTVGLAFGMALLASYVGLSVAIGAFLMGMMIASSRKSKDINHDIEPMKNIFMAMFFISVGMEISLVTLIDNIGLTVALLILFVVMKSLAVFLGYWLANDTPRNSVSSAVSFLAMGEFAFIIAKQALDYNVFSDTIYTSIVGAALLSMVTLPFISKNATRHYDYMYERLPDGIMNMFKKINATKVAFYSGILNSPNKSRREMLSSVTMSYICILLLAVIEIVFILVAPTISGWAFTYFGGSVLLWSITVLLINLFALYIPTYTLIENIKDIYRKANTSNADSARGNVRFTVIDSFLMTHTLLIALMIDITILIIMPNGLDIWEHIVVLAIALVILLVLNKRSLRKRAEQDSYDVEDEDFNNMDTDSFKALVRSKVSDPLEEEKVESVVSIDSGDMTR